MTVQRSVSESERKASADEHLISPRVQILVLVAVILLIVLGITAIVQQVEILSLQKQVIANEQDLVNANQVNAGYDKGMTDKINSLCSEVFPGGGCK